MPKINSLEVVHQDTNKDSYETLHDIIVGLKGSQNQEVVDGEARALYESLLELYTNDKEAFAKRIETLQAEFGDSLAKVVEEMLAYASKSEAWAKRITKVSAEVANSNAMVLTEMYTRATEDEALAQLITTLEATVDANTAAIITEQTVRVTEDEALASIITTLSATVGDNTAAITTEQIARATADSALASSISTLSATVGSKNRTYYQTTAPSSGMVSGDLWIDSDDDKLYRYNGSSWVNIQDNQIGVNTAAITNEASARATADSANATAINGVTARLDTGDFAAVKTQSSATASKVAGIEAKWGVTTNVNGYVAGIQLLNGGSTQSSFTVDATKFIVKKPDGSNGIVWNGSNSRLDVSGDIYANNFYGNVVGTTNVNANAITNSASAQSGLAPVSATISTAGGAAIFIFGAVWAIPGEGSYEVVRLSRNGVVLQEYSLTNSQRVPMLYRDNPPSGTYTYTIETLIYPGYDPTIMLLETKR